MLISQSPIKKEMKEEQTTGVIKNKIRLASIENAVKLAVTALPKDWETTPYLVLKGAYSYVNGKTILNNISGIYNTELGEAKSITAEEINRLIGVTVDYTNKKVYANSNPDVNIDEYKVLGNQYPYTADNYTPESYIDNKSHATAGEKTDPATAYAYQWGNLTIGDTLKTILFSGTTRDANYAKSYWLASSGVYADSSYANFGPGCVRNGGVGSDYGLFDSDGIWDAFGLAVRPVVYLNSEVTVEDLHIIDGQEDNWSAYSNGDAVANGDSSNGEAGNHGT